MGILCSVLDFPLFEFALTLGLGICTDIHRRADRDDVSWWASSIRILCVCPRAAQVWTGDASAARGSQAKLQWFDYLQSFYQREVPFVERGPVASTFEGGRCHNQVVSPDHFAGHCRSAQMRACSHAVCTV